MTEEETKKNVLHLLPSKSTNKLKGAKPNTRIIAKAPPVTPNSNIGELNKKTNLLSNDNLDNTTKASIIEQNTKQEVVGSIKRGRGRPRKNPDAPAKTKKKLTQEERNAKRAMKDELRAAKRREKEAKRIERQMAKEEERRRKVMIEARRKAILADKIKQHELQDTNKDSSTTQMGSFKIANSTPPVTQAIRPLPNTALPINSNPTQEVTAVPIDDFGSYRFTINKPKNAYMRRLEAYANRELDPSIIPMFNSLIARKRLAGLLTP